MRKKYWHTVPVRRILNGTFVLLGEFSTKLTVHHLLSTIQLHTRETGHRVDWARAQLHTVSIEHEHNCVPYRLSTLKNLSEEVVDNFAVYIDQGF